MFRCRRVLGAADRPGAVHRGFRPVGGEMPRSGPERDLRGGTVGLRLPGERATTRARTTPGAARAFRLLVRANGCGPDQPGAEDRGPLASGRASPGPTFRRPGTSPASSLPHRGRAGGETPAWGGAPGVRGEPGAPRIRRCSAASPPKRRGWPGGRPGSAQPAAGLLRAGHRRSGGPARSRGRSAVLPAAAVISAIGGEPAAPAVR